MAFLAAGVWPLTSGCTEPVDCGPRSFGRDSSFPLLAVNRKRSRDRLTEFRAFDLVIEWRRQRQMRASADIRLQVWALADAGISSDSGRRADGANTR